MKSVALQTFFCIWPRSEIYINPEEVIVTRQFLPVIYQAGVKVLFHCLCRLSWLNLELLAVISSRECAAAAAPDYFCLCSGFYAFCFTHWQSLLLILKKGWLVRCPTPPLPLWFSTTGFGSVWRAIQPPTRSIQVVFPLLKTHLSVDWEGVFFMAKACERFPEQK